MVLNTHFIWGYTSIGKIYLALTIFLLIMILQCALIMAVIFVFLRGEYFLRNREFPFLPFFDWRRGQTRYKISIIFPVAQKTVNNCPKWISDTFLWDWHWFRKVPTLWIILRIFGPVKIPPIWIWMIVPSLAWAISQGREHLSSCVLWKYFSQQTEIGSSAFGDFT